MKTFDLRCSKRFVTLVPLTGCFEPKQVAKCGLSRRRNVPSGNNQQPYVSRRGTMLKEWGDAVLQVLDVDLGDDFQTLRPKVRRFLGRKLSSRKSVWCVLKNPLFLLSKPANSLYRSTGRFFRAKICCPKSWQNCENKRRSFWISKIILFETDFARNLFHFRHFILFWKHLLCFYLKQKKINTATVYIIFRALNLTKIPFFPIQTHWSGSRDC